MDFSTWTSIVGIILTIISMFISVNRNSNNKNISNSFNTVKINQNRTVNEYHEHKYYNSNSYSNNPSDSNDTSAFILIAIISIIGFGLAIFYYIKYQELIMISFTSIMLLTLIVTILVIYYKKTLPISFKFYLLGFFIVNFILVILISYPIFIPESIMFVEKQFSNIQPQQAPSKLWNLHQGEYQKEVFFLISQIAGIVGLLGQLIKHYFILFKMSTNRFKQSIKSLIYTDIIITCLLFVLISGLFAKLIFYLQNI